jgi:hypothetical protein
MRFALGRSEGVLPPQTISLVFATFDASWPFVEGAFHGRPQADIDHARETLTNALVNCACAGHVNPDELQQEGIRAVKAILADDAPRCPVERRIGEAPC